MESPLKILNFVFYPINKFFKFIRLINIRNHKNFKIYFTACFFLITIFLSCEKEIELEIPIQNNVLVVDGKIESGQPPYIILTNSVSYFEPTGINSFLNSFEHNAKVSILVNGTQFILPELCTNTLPPELIPLAAAFLGISTDELKGYNYCLYTVSLPDLLSGKFLAGEPGKIYRLTIESGGKIYSASTKIPEIIHLDSVWFKPNTPEATHGLAWAHLTDPDTLGNAYRWFAKRISHGSYGQIKDNNFIPPIGSAFNDQFINGKSFDFGYDRGNRPSEEGVDLPGEKPHFYKISDTIVIKFCTIEKSVMHFIRKYEAEIWNNGNPFASPSTLPTNIEGGAFGLWAGYGVSMDTIYSK